MGMIEENLTAELFAQLADPFTGEALFDCFADIVFFIKNARGEYVVVNQTMARIYWPNQSALGRRVRPGFLHKA